MDIFKTIIDMQLSRYEIAFKFDKITYEEYLAAYRFAQDLYDELGLSDDDD